MVQKGVLQLCFNLSNVKLIRVLSNLDFAPRKIVQPVGDDVLLCGGCKWGAILKGDIMLQVCWLVFFHSHLLNVAALLYPPGFLSHDLCEIHFKRPF